MKRILTKGQLWGVFCRLGLLQASWNFQRLQNLGVLFALGPALRSLYSGDEQRDAAKRHLVYFNTHPFMAPAALGASLAIDEAVLTGQMTPVSSEDFRRMTMAPFAAMGDALFWGGLRPLAACFALFFAFSGSLWAPVVFLVLFNIPHLLFAVVGFWAGYLRRHQVLEYVAKKRFPDLAIRAKEVMIILLGGLCAFQIFQVKPQPLPYPMGMLVALMLILAAGYLFRRGWSALMLLLATLAGALAFAGLF